MNRLLVVALAAALSQFGLACTTDRTEIYEPDPAQESDQTGDTTDFIDTAKVSDTPDLNFPVPAQASTPIDPIAIKAEINPNNPFSEGVLDPNAIIPSGIDRAGIEMVNPDGTITTTTPVDVIDPNQLNSLPGVEVLFANDALPSRSEAAALPDGLPPL